MTVAQLLTNISSYEISMWIEYYKVKAVEAEMQRNRR
jgi:hypothetical protein